MASSVDSARFSELYRSLPLDAQQSLVENQLIPLLKHVPRQRAKKVNAAVTRLHRRHRNIPVLDLKAKKLEVNLLLEELEKDSKRAFVMDKSSKPEILSEILNSCTDWLNDVWSMAYEHNVNYELVHECLLFICDTLTRLASVRSCCNCSLSNMYIPVVIKTKSGRIVKRFDVDGAPNLEVVMGFIWRDMFLSMLASGKRRHRQLVSEMLKDCETNSGWPFLIRILRGGSIGDEEDEDEADEEEWDNTDDAGESSSVGQWEDVGTSRSRHWPLRIRSCVTELRALTEDVMKRNFEALPSSRLYDTLIGIATDPNSLSEELHEMLDSVATTCSDAMAVALEIYAGECNGPAITRLLQNHSHLIRPRDAPALQKAVIALSEVGHAELGLSILRKELVDTARTVRQALLLSYSRLDVAANRNELFQVIKLPSGAPRRARIETWVDSISSPGADAPIPFMFAAMMMGVPPMPGMNPDDDAYTYLDLDPHDPDLEDLRHEFRPALKRRFESWVDVAHRLKNGSAVLLTTYKFLIEFMPFLRAPDVTEEMIGRLDDRPSKQFVCDGLDALLAFAKIQKRKWNVAKAELQKRKKAEARPSTSASSSTNNTISSFDQSSISAAATTPTTASVPLPPMFPVSLPSGQANASLSQATASSSKRLSDPDKEPSLTTPPHLGASNGQSVISRPISPYIPMFAGPSTPTPQTTAGLPFLFATPFGAGVASTPPATEPSLDDVD
ncbi:hypothetical protein BC835DRAFT_276645 [Cytidiella melzeri]|nr:hypothetical protein BC835DRAFT_276645 [Cytidiella melzeri]